VTCATFAFDADRRPSCMETPAVYSNPPQLGAYRGFATAAYESNSGAEPPDVRCAKVGRIAQSG
jgi:hypothetical protein